MEDINGTEVPSVFDDDEKQEKKIEEDDQNRIRKSSYVISPKEREILPKIKDQAAIFGHSQDSDVSHKTFDVDQNAGHEEISIVPETLVHEQQNATEKLDQLILEKGNTAVKDAEFEKTPTIVESERKIQDWLATTQDDPEKEKETKSSNRSDQKTVSSEKRSIQRATSMVNLTDLKTKRSELHTDWFKKKEQLLKQQKKQNLILEEQKEKLKLEKENQSKIVYESWKKLKDEQIKIKRKIISESRILKEKEEKESKEQKRQDALKVYEVWRKSKEAQMKENSKKENKLAQEQEAKNKREEARLVFEQWKKSKDQEIQDKLLSIKKSETLKKSEQNQLYEERRHLADLAYEQWLENKDFEEFLTKRAEMENNQYEKGSESILENNFKIPWLPPSCFVFEKKNFCRNNRKRCRTSSAKVRGYYSKP